MKTKKMKKRLNEDEVVDEQGRRRFHGAFTGGFSAGYFNSVGSAEGWKPAAFVSSRCESNSYNLTHSQFDIGQIGPHDYSNQHKTLWTMKMDFLGGF
jgi:hypothetical protein